MPVISLERTRVVVAERLRSRRPEIEEAILARVFSVSGRSERADPQYAHGLRATVSAAIEHGLSALECSEDRSPPIPPVLLAQARLAVRGGVSLDTVLRRYFVGYTLLGDFVIAEAERSDLLRGVELQQLLRGQAALFDRVIASVSDEYAREEQGSPPNAEQRRVERVKRLLAGDLLDTSGLAYDFTGSHLGFLAIGTGAEEALAEAAKQVGLRHLTIRHEEGTLWAWLGSRSRIDPALLAARPWPSGVSIALGENGQGLAGWRLTHRQARAALPIALRGPKRVVRYADVALMASMLRDELLVTSLRELYIEPLKSERDGGVALRETLLAYFAAERNVSSAAAALGVSRRTVSKRLRMSEELLGKSLTSAAVEMEAAFRLDDLQENIDGPVRNSGTLPRR